MRWDVLANNGQDNMTVQAPAVALGELFVHGWLAWQQSDLDRASAWSTSHT